MEQSFKRVPPTELTDNPFKLIHEDKMLVTAGNLERFNTMTASWGGLGILWHKPVAFCVIRPVRYTYEFMESADRFTLSFFTDEYRDVLQMCGSVSGRETDKAEAADITPVQEEPGAVFFKEARLVLECRKLYYQDIDPEQFVDKELDTFYPRKDYHRMYVGEIISCRIKE